MTMNIVVKKESIEPASVSQSGGQRFVASDTKEYRTRYEHAREEGARYVQLLLGDVTTTPKERLYESPEPSHLLQCERAANLIPLVHCRSLPPTEDYPQGQVVRVASRNLVFEGNGIIFTDQRLMTPFTNNNSNSKSKEEKNNKETAAAMDIVKKEDRKL